MGVRERESGMVREVSDVASGVVSESDAELAHALLQEALRLRGSLYRARLRLFVILYELRVRELYRVLGYSTWGEFLGAHNFGVKRDEIALGFRVVRFIAEHRDELREALLKHGEELLRLVGGGKVAGEGEVDVLAVCEQLDVSKLEDVRNPVSRALRDGRHREAVEWLVLALPVDRGGLSRSSLQERLCEEGFMERRPFPVLCLRGVSKAEIIHTNAPEELFADWDMIVRVTNIIKGAQLVEVERDDEAELGAG